MEKTNRKVGILTYSTSNNYGAVLQALALGKFISRLGYAVKFIKYRQPSDEIANTHPPLKTRLKILVWKILVFLLFAKAKKAAAGYKKSFEEFREKHMDFTSRKLASAEDVRADAEAMSFGAYVVGSDWVWKKPFDDVYFLSFLKDSEAVRIAYAASADKANIASGDQGELRRRLLNFDSISTREELLTANINAVSELKSVTLPDPVLLFDSDFWSRYAGDEPIVKGDYMLVYSMKPRKSFSKAARKCKKILGIKSVGIVPVGSVANLIGANTDEILPAIGPAEFLNLVKHAKFVITSSFHGIAFSMIFKVPFLSYTFEKHDARMKNLISNAGFGDREISSSEGISRLDLSDYDFSKADLSFGLWRENARKFLKENLEKQYPLGRRKCR